MSKSHGYLHTRLRMEKEKLLGWAVLAKVSQGDHSVFSAPRLHRHAINDALREIQDLLLDFQQLENRYKLKFFASDGRNVKTVPDAESPEEKVGNEFGCKEIC